MLLRQVLAATATTVALLAVPTLASAAEADPRCEGVETLEVVTPAGRFEGGWPDFADGRVLDRFDLDDRAHELRWSTAGHEVTRIVVTAGRNDLVFDEPSATLVLDTTREVTSVLFCGSSLATGEAVVELETGDATERPVDIGQAELVEIADAVVITREAPTPEVVQPPLPDVAPVTAPAPAAPAPVEPAPVAPPSPAVPVVTTAPVATSSTPEQATEAPATAPALITVAVPPGARFLLAVGDTPPAAATPDPVVRDRSADVALIAATPTLSGPQPLPVGTFETVALTLLGMIAASSTSRLLGTRR